MNNLPSRRALPLAALALAFGLTALLLGALASFRPAYAQLAPAAADAIGLIAGVVTDDAGAPLAGMRVDVYAADTTSSDGPHWVSVRQAATDAAGHYTAAVPPGIYRVGFSDPSDAYAHQYYRSVPAIAKANDLPVSGNTVANIDARLLRAGAIAGSAEFGPLFRGRVTAYALLDGAWEAVQTVGIENEAYVLRGLPPGVYRVCLSRTLEDRPLTPCYDRRAAGIAYADDVTVTAGIVVSSINLAPGGFVDLATIRGVVRGEDGAPLAHIQVEVSGTDRAGTYTDAAGTYTVQVAAPGEFQVFFSNPEGYYLPQRHGGSPFPLQPYEERTLDMQLQKGGRISGVWESWSSPQLLAVAAADPAQIYRAELFAAQEYEIGPLPPGVYYVCDYIWRIDLQQFDPRCYAGDVPLAAATPITVAAGATVTGIDRAEPLPPPAGAVLTGAVTGPDGQPLAGMAVELLRRAQYLAAATTDAQGHYRFEGLADDDWYYVRVADPGGVYATTFYSDAVTLARATDIAVREGQNPPPADVRLPLGGAASGRVMRADGQPLARARVSVYKVSEYPEFHGPAAVVTADAAGVFHVRGLRPGQYRICAEASEPPRYEENCYGTPPVRSTTLVYAPVAVTAGAEHAGVAITLGPGPIKELFLPALHRTAPGPVQGASGSSPEARGAVAGAVYGPDGQPLGGITVVLEQATAGGGWAPMAGTESGADGRYRIDQLAPGLYRVRFDDLAAVYAPQYYPGAIAPVAAETLNVNGNALSGIDAQLTRGGSLEGSIIGAQYPYNAVTAYVQIGGEWQEVQTTYAVAAPHYRFANLPPATYRVCTPYVHDFAGRGPCYDRSSDIAYAADVPLAAGAVLTGIDITLAGLPDAAAIGGTVRDLAGAPLAGIAVFANAPAGSPSGWLQIAVTRTNAAGEYRLADLPPAEYVVSFADPDGNYLPQVYAGVDNFAQAQPLALGRSEERSGIDARLRPAGALSGVITFGGPHPAPASRVEAHDCTNAGPRYSTLSDPITGAYRIDGLPPGVYCVLAVVFDSSGLDRYTGHYSTRPDGEPTPLSVTLGSRIGGIDIAVAADTFTGVITGTVTGEGGRPLAGIRVELLAGGALWDLPPLVYTLTGSDGSYRFDGLERSQYALRFVDPAGVYAPMYAVNQRRPGDALPVSVLGEQPLGPIDTQLPRSGRIFGQVHDAGGAPVAGAAVSFQLPRDGLSLYGDTIAVVRSDAAGAYSSGPLPPGDYQVCAAQYIGMDYRQACVGYEYGAEYPGLTLPLQSGETQTADFVPGYVPQFAHKLYLPTVTQEPAYP